MLLSCICVDGFGNFLGTNEVIMPDTAVVFGPLNGSCHTAVVMSLGPMCICVKWYRTSLMSGSDLVRDFMIHELFIHNSHG